MSGMRKLHIALVLAGVGMAMPALGEEEFSLDKLKDLCLDCGRGGKAEADKAQEGGVVPMTGGRELRLNLGMSNEELRAMENPEASPMLPRRVIR